MKIRQVGAELLHADGQTDMTNLIVSFRNFAKAPKSGSLNGSSCDMIGYWRHCRG
jgi:hypothetical protein